MVFGNAGERSATGVAFSRDPSTGRSVATASSSSTHRARTSSPAFGPRSRSRARRSSRTRTANSGRRWKRLEQHYRDVQDVEFTIEQGTLYILQTRSAKRTAAAAVRIAVDMVHEGLISREEAVLRIEPTRSTTCSIRWSTRPRPSTSRRPACRPHRARRSAPSSSTPTWRPSAATQRTGGPRPLRYDPGRHPRSRRRAGHPHRARRHGVARGGRRARHGQAMRRRLRRAPDRRDVTFCEIGGTHVREGEQITIDGSGGR